MHRLRLLERGKLFRGRPTFGVAVSLLLAAIGLGMAIYLLVLTRS